MKELVYESYKESHSCIVEVDRIYNINQMLFRFNVALTKGDREYSFSLYKFTDKGWAYVLDGIKENSSIDECIDYLFDLVAKAFKEE